MKKLIAVILLFLAAAAQGQTNTYNLLDVPASSGGGSPGGTSGQIQYNNGGTAFGGFGSYNAGTSTVTVPNFVATGSATVSSLVSNGAASLGATVVASPFTVVSGGSTVASVVGNLFTVGSGTTTSAGVQMGYLSATGLSGLAQTGVTASATNAFLSYDGASTFVNAAGGGQVILRQNGTNIFLASNASLNGSVDGSKSLGLAGVRFSSAFLGSSTAITASAPAIDVAQTWNNAAVAFTAAKINATNTASAAGSLLQDWQVASTSVANLGKAGNFQVADGTAALPSYSFISGGNWGWHWTSGVGPVFSGNGSDTMALQQNLVSLGNITRFGWSSAGPGNTLDTGFARNAAGVVEVNNGTAGTFAALKLSTLTATAVAPTVSAGQIGFGGTTSATATAGASITIPALAQGYIVVNIAGTTAKIPYYNN